MARQARHERNQMVAVHPELVEGFVQRFLNLPWPFALDIALPC